MNDRHFSNFNLAGFTFYEGADVFTELKIGIELAIKAEPENKYDPNAVALYYNEKKLGYIPRSENKAIAKFLACGYTNLFEARINRLSPESVPENQVGVVMRIVEWAGGETTASD